jgi:hypothetical protein
MFISYCLALCDGMAEDRQQIATIRTLISGATMLSDYKQFVK